jgi:hypothetical protein
LGITGDGLSNKSPPDGKKTKQKNEQYNVNAYFVSATQYEVGELSISINAYFKKHVTYTKFDSQYRLLYMYDINEIVYKRIKENKNI